MKPDRLTKDIGQFNQPLAAVLTRHVPKMNILRICKLFRSQLRSRTVDIMHSQGSVRSVGSSTLRSDRRRQLGFSFENRFSATRGVATGHVYGPSRQRVSEMWRRAANLFIRPCPGRCRRVSQANRHYAPSPASRRRMVEPEGNFQRYDPVEADFLAGGVLVCGLSEASRPRTRG